ncbi:MAG: ArgE/DapE family deacylase [Candidatus Thorarchaeota archaeon]|nr:MAG: ArgE/DapE family deacylase [Candidatus Thorarchaeota archaeon]
MNEETSATRVLTWIREHKELLIRTTQDLVRIPSISGDESEVQGHVFEYLKRLGLHPEYVYPDLSALKEHADYFETTSFVKNGYKDRPNVSAKTAGSGGGRSICLSGHVDVVSPEPTEQWSRYPWSGDVADNWLYGRGAGDMKAGVAALLILLQALTETKTKLKGDLFFETTIEEEDGGVGGNLYMRMVSPKADAAIIPEPTALNLTVASAGVMYFRVIVPGVPAHAATAHFGVNAVEKMLPILQALKGLNEHRQSVIHYPYAETDPLMKGKATTINVGTVRAGDWPSTVPGSCTIECRIGWPPGETREEVRKQVEDTIRKAARQDEWLKDNMPHVEWFGWNARPHELDPEHPFVLLLSENAVRVGCASPVYYGGAAGLDTRFFVHNGIPAVTFGPKAERIHSYDERVSIESIVKTAEVIAVTVLDWCGVAE